MTEWYKNPKTVMEFAEFLVESDQMTTAEELLDYFEHPEKYVEVWRLYQEEIVGISPVSLNTGPVCKPRQVPILVALVEPSAQCQPEKV